MLLKAAGALLAAMLVATAAATAQNEPETISDAQLGTLHVTTAIYVSRTAVEMRGVWTDKHVKCRVKRKLRVRAEVNYIPKTGAPRRFVMTGLFADANCAEGGPNVGFTITAKSLGLACANGSWKPARYDFVAGTIEPTRKLRALADLSWFRTGAC